MLSCSSKEQFGNMKWLKCCCSPALSLSLFSLPMKLMLIFVVGLIMLASIVTLPRWCEAPSWTPLPSQMPLPKSSHIDRSHPDFTPQSHNIIIPHKPRNSTEHTSIAMPTTTTQACLSKWQHLLYRSPSSVVELPPDLALALKSYQRMHARCSHNKTITSWRNSFYNGDPDDSCRYLVYVEGTAGLGNRLLSLASAFVYALLTDRVLLMDPRGHMPLLLCEPFEWSSWRLPEDFPMWDVEYGSPKIGDALSSSSGFNSSRVLLSLRHEQSDGDKQFYCGAVQEKLEQVAWIGWHSNQYLIPRFFTFSSFWPRLLRLFPDVSLTTTHLSRYLFLPNNQVWERIVRIHWSYSVCSSKKVSLQVRLHARKDKAEFYHPAFSQIMRCLIGHHILPNVIIHPPHHHRRANVKLIKPFLSHVKQLRSQSPVVLKAEMSSVACKMTTSVLVASLQTKYYEELKGMFMNSPTEDDTFVRVHMATYEGSEIHSYDQSVKAFTEIWLLSLGDEIATSSWSTFGYVAQSLGALRPYVMNIRGEFDKEGLPPCFVGQSVDPCNHYPFMGTECEGETLSFEHTRWMETHIKPCQDEGGGIQLVQESIFVKQTSERTMH